MQSANCWDLEPEFLAASTEMIEEIFLLHGCLNYNQADCRRGPLRIFMLGAGSAVHRDRGLFWTIAS